MGSDRSDLERVKGFLAESPPVDLTTARLEDLFGQLALSEGFITKAQLDECVREQAEERRAGRNLPIGQILLRRGHLSSGQFQRLLTLQNRDLRICSQCTKLHDITGHPPHVKLRCLNCGQELPSTEKAGAGSSDPPVPAPSETALPRRLGKYVLVREIARGGMGVVYEAQDVALKRRVALKTMIEKEFTGPDEVARLQREAAIAGRLFHPNIVGVHEVGTVADPSGKPLHFIALDYVQGRTLGQILAEGKSGREARVAILADVARAVAFAHGQGVIHRDLKPGNVLVADDGRVMLTDFGLARAESFTTRLTQSQAIMGTPEYMAPEQAEGRTKDIDFRTDVHGLGVMLYELLTGRVPFSSENPNTLFRQIAEQDPVPPRRLDPSIDKDLEVICLKAMAKERDQRYATGEAFAEDLRRYLAGEPIAARALSQVYRLRKAFWKGKRMAAMIAIATVVSAGVVGVLVVQHAQEGVFESGREGAEQAFARRDWKVARMDAERALALRMDARLLQIAEDSRRALEQEEAEASRVRSGEGLHEKRLAEAEAYQKMRESLRPVEEMLNELRPSVYIAGVDLTPRIQSLERELERLEPKQDAGAPPPHPEVLRTLGLGWYLVGDGIRAEEFLRQVEERAPEDGLVSYTLGRLYLERSQAMLLQSGCSALEEEKRQSVSWVEEALKRLSRRTQGWTGAQPIDVEIAAAYRAMAEGHAEEVTGRCEDALKRYGTVPGTEEFWNLLGWVRSGDARIAAYAKALARRPHYAWGYFMRGLAQAEKGDFDAAIADYDAALKINPRLSEVYNGRAQAYSAKGDRERSIGNYSWALRFNPHCSFALYHRGVERRASGDLAQALADFNEVTAIAPRYADAYAERGRLRAQQGDAQGAVEDFSRALEVASTEWPGREETAKLLADAKARAKAASRKD